MNNSEDVQAYFAGLANRHTEISGFSFGMSKELIDASAKREGFPLLHVEPPEISYQGKLKNRYRRMQLAFTVFVQRNSRPNNEPSDTSTEERRSLQGVLSKAQEIAEDVLFMFEHEFADNREVTVEGEAAKLEGVTALTNNLDEGYRCEVVVMSLVGTCVDASKWN
jgi:hypothetical protein